MNYRIIRSNRKTIALQITSDGQLQIRCPNQMSVAAVQRFVDSKSRWVQQKLALIDTRPKLPVFTQAELHILTQQARAVISERVKHYAPSVAASYNRITIRSQRSRWGSCSSNGNLSFNCLLMLVPQEVLDYVVVHELCHLKELNHSKRFWAEVEGILPDYRLHKKWLKENSAMLLGRLEKTTERRH